MLREHEDRGDFWLRFCGETDSWLAHTSLEADRLDFQQRINQILERAGLQKRLRLTRSARNPDCAE